jgi:hypothetical protein
MRQKQRLKDLKKLGLLARRTVEKADFYQQRPQTTHSLFLSGKSLRFCNLRTTSCQTGEDDVEVETMTDEVWTDEKDMQFPTLAMGQPSKAGGEQSQMLSFLRRALPIFEASMNERGSQRPQQDWQQQQQQQQGSGGEVIGAQHLQLECSFPDIFTTRFLGVDRVTIADVAVCPEWYGADHALLLHTWPWQRTPPTEQATSSLEAFVRPLQSIMGLYPILSHGDVQNASARPVRCLYSFCRLSSVVVVNGRPHLIIAGSEMGSQQVRD